MVYGWHNVAVFFSFRVFFYLFFSFCPEVLFLYGSVRRPIPAQRDGAINRFHGFDCGNTYTGRVACWLVPVPFFYYSKSYARNNGHHTTPRESIALCEENLLLLYIIYIYTSYTCETSTPLKRDGLQKPDRCAPHV